MTATLGKYFAPPILSAASGGDARRLAKHLLDQSEGEWPAAWPQAFNNVLGGAETPIDTKSRWTGIERTIGKEAWLTTTPPKPPWALVKGRTPAIVTFHSFKGGVGRTTLLAAYAIRLASGTHPRRVAVVDLDLEAPGIGLLLGADTERGVIDVLVDHIATGDIDLQGSGAPTQIDRTIDSQITVFPAGRPDDVYLQKLARLDFSSTEPGKENPVGAALASMLKSMKAKYDVILLDSRAGLHDLAGMSLHGLAHVHVLVFRGTKQHLTGLGQTLRVLGSQEASKLVLVETMLPNDEKLFLSHRERTRGQVYELLCEHVYPDEDPPQLVDIGEPHDVVSVHRREWLDGIDSLAGHLDSVLQDDDLREVRRRIDDECALESESEGAEADENEEIE